MVKHLLSSNLISDNSFYNIGDVFYTLRKDSSLNGAVEANGATYNCVDFGGYSPY